MKGIIAFLIFLSSHSLLVLSSNITEDFTFDPLEVNHNWEIAIRQVLLSNDATNASTSNATTPTNVSDEVESTTQYTEIEIDTVTNFNFQSATETAKKSESSTATTSIQIDFEAPKVIIEEAKEHDDEDDEEEKAESNTQLPKVVEPENTGKEELSAEDEDEEIDNSSKGRADRMRAILQEAMAANQLKTINVNKNDSDLKVWTSWAKAVNMIRTENTIFLRSVLTPIVMDTFYEVPDLGSSCASALLAMGTAAETEMWATQMIESSGRLPIGLLSGTSASFGDFDQCLAVKVFDNDQETLRLQGKYCLVEFSFPVPSLKPGERLLFNDDSSWALLKSVLANNTDIKMSREIETAIRRLVYFSYTTKLYNGICIPHACTGSDIEVLIKNAIGNFMQLNVTDCVVSKHTNAKEIKDLTTIQLMTKYMVDFVNSLDQFQIVSLMIYGICSSLVALASVLDWFVLPQVESRKSNAITIYTQSFSVRSNWNRLFTVSSTQKYSRLNPDLRFINGIRVLTMFWIVFAHVCILGTLFAPMLVYRYEEEARPFGRSLIMQFIYNGYASVEVFFFISGFVLIFLTLRPKKSSSKVLRVPPLSLYAAVRALRLLIPMIGILSLHFLWPILGDGPVYEKFTSQLLNACRTNWWKNLLLVNNYDETPDLCLVHTWFLSADFQLHLIAYPLIVLLSVSETLGLLFNLVLILGGAIVPAMLHYQRHAPATLSAFIEVFSKHFFEDMKFLYYPVHIHLSSYFVGFMLGYLLLKRLKKDSSKIDGKVKVLPNRLIKRTTYSSAQKKNICSFLLTIMFGVIAVVSVFGAYVWSREEGPLIVNEKIGSFYFGFHRLAFILFPAWVVWFFVKDVHHQNPIRRILSSYLTQVLSRLSFSVYLVHILVVWYYVLTTRSFIRFRLPDLLFIAGGVLLYSLPLAIAFHLIFEAPWSNLLKHCQQGVQSATRTTSKEEDEETETNEGSDPYELYIGRECMCRTVSEHTLECQQHKPDKNGNTLSHLTIQ